MVLTLQRVPKTVKQRMHLGLLAGNVEAEIHRLESLGASPMMPTARQVCVRPVRGTATSIQPHGIIEPVLQWPVPDPVEISAATLIG
jgi:hypothetical protein